MKLKNLKFWKASDKDREKLKKYLLKEFPGTCFMATVPDNIKITNGKISIDQSIPNWILAMADHYQVNDVFKLFFWQKNNPIDDLINGTEEYKEEE